MRLPQLNLKLRALSSRNYRLFFFGQGTSLIGTWMNNVAAIWAVYRLTDSPLVLGVFGFLSQSPAILAPLAGSYVDRHNRRQILLATQMISMLQSLTLAALALTNTLNIGNLIILSFIQGVINALDLPTRQAFLPEMVDKRADLNNAIALNASLLGLSRLLGPAIAGVIIARYSTGICFLIDGLSYIAVLASLLAMKISPSQTLQTTHTKFSQRELIAGFRYAFNSIPIRVILILLALVNFMGTPLIALGPVFAREFLGGSSHTFGYMMTTSAVGALIGAVYLSLRSGLVGLERLYGFAAAMLGVVLIVFSQSRVVWLSFMAVAFIGLFLIINNAASNTMILTMTEADKQGRVMGIYTIASDSIMLPCGNLFAGVLAYFVGAPSTMLIEGICCLVGAIIFWQYLPIIERSLKNIS
ncbi:MFS transporter [Myxosarcina sp. GI1]|uniref:MFS transporter n=1 Tax=Myxosarcina sp. GI1 TaxID=1541065 RepID=UPI00056A56B0|nr:MFS transporter [Myxosarcina sp. GI1]